MRPRPVTGYRARIFAYAAAPVLKAQPDGRHMVPVAAGRFWLLPTAGHRDPRLVCKSKGDKTTPWRVEALDVAAAGLRWIDRPEPTDMEP
jgi:hypothetical protein